MNHIPRRSFYIAALFICLFAGQSTVHAATLGMSGGGSYAVGDLITASVVLSTAPGETANAFSATINYPSADLDLISISKAGSIVSLWPQEPNYSQSAGTVDLEGVILNPGWSGTQGKLATIVFRAKVASNAQTAFAPGARVLANDGQGTDILSSASGTTFAIAEAKPAPAAPAPVGKPAAPVTTPTKSVTPNAPETPQASSTAPAATTTAYAPVPGRDYGDLIIVALLFFVLGWIFGRMSRWNRPVFLGGRGRKNK